MTVWLVNAFWDLPQEGNRAQRYWLMAEAFARAGHSVVYWSSDFSHITKSRRKLSGVSLDGDSYVAGGVRVVLLPTMPYKRNISLKRVLSHLALARAFSNRAARETAKPDLVVGCTPPLGLCDAARKFARKAGAVFVCDIQDAWPETFERVFPRFALAPLRAVARRIYRDADAIVATGTQYLALAAKYGARAPMQMLTQVIAPRENNKPSPNNHEPLRLVYCGNMSHSYDLATLVNAVCEMPHVTLDLAGNGPDRPMLENLASSCKRISFHGYLGERELADLLDSCDAGVIPMLPESCVNVPGKTADYAAAHLRVVECLGGDCAAVLDSVKAGVHYKPRDVASLKAALEKLPSLEPDFDAFSAMFDGVKVMDDFVKFAMRLCR